MTAKKHIRVGQLTALFSFIFGTTIFLIYYFTSKLTIISYTYGLTLFTLLFNIGILTAIIVKSSSDKEHRKNLMITSGVILLNIPIMIVYFWFVIILLGTMRITLTNKMDNDITDISLVGCENKRIKKLKAGQSKTVWISIKKECSIYVEYVTKGMRKGEIVYDYVTPGMGQLVEHELDGENRRIVL